MAERIGDLKKAAAGAEISFTLRIQLDQAAKLSKESLTQIQELLAEISTRLQLH